MIDTTINLLVNRTECTNLSDTTLTLRLAVKSDNSSPAILFRDSEKLDATIKLSLTLPTLQPPVPLAWWLEAAIAAQPPLVNTDRAWGSLLFVDDSPAI